MEAGTCCCPEHSKITSESECRDAVIGVGIQNLSFSGLNPNLPSGCSAQYGSTGSFNTGDVFDSRGDMLPICKYKFGTAATTGAQFYRMPLGSAACQTSHKISSVEECVGAAGALGLIVASLESPWVGETEIIPAGCSHQYGGRAHWNKAASGTPRPDMLPMCAQPPTEDLKYFRMPPGFKDCKEHDPIHSIEECKAAAAAVGFDTNIAQTVWEGISSAIPLSCSGQLGGRPHYNYDSVGGNRSDVFPICKFKAGSLVEIHTEIQQTLHADGQIDIARAPSLAPLALGFTTPGGYFKLDFGADQSACGTDLIGIEAECKSGAQAIGIDIEQGMWMGNSPWWHAGTWQGVPKGCWVLSSRAYWNNDNPTNTSEAHNDLPSKQISAHALDPVKRSERPAQAQAAATAAPAPAAMTAPPTFPAPNPAPAAN